MGIHRAAARGFEPSCYEEVTAAIESNNVALPAQHIPAHSTQMRSEAPLRRPIEYQSTLIYWGHGAYLMCCHARSQATVTRHPAAGGLQVAVRVVPAHQRTCAAHALQLADCGPSRVLGVVPAPRIDLHHRAWCRNLPEGGAAWPRVHRSQERPKIFHIVQ